MRGLLSIYLVFAILASPDCKEQYTKQNDAAEMQGIFPRREFDSVKVVNDRTDTNKDKMKIKVGTSVFSATLYHNATAAAFRQLLPLVVEMTELNGNEKYVNLSQTLPSNPSNPATIQNGDVMLYGSSTLVLFYKTFKSSYDYTIVARINDVTGLAAALGQKNVKVTFELE